MSEPRLPHHTVLRRIGRGGMGEVWLARDERLSRNVALKVLAPELADDETQRRRLLREARAAAALSHPGIVRIHAVEEVDGRPVISMEHVTGTPLSMLIPGGGLPLARLLDMGIQLADAVAAAHAAGIIHRDLKPANVLVEEGDRTRILDFGLARGAPEPGDDAVPAAERPTRDALTGPLEVVGTLAYMSPEQVEGRPLDARTDIFSLGVMLHEMATGRRPFHGDSDASLLSSILRDQAPRLSDGEARLPRELGRIVRRCLEKDRERRFQTARDVANELIDLRDGLTGDEPSGAPAGPPPKARRVGGPTLLVVSLLALAAGVAIGAFIGSRSPRDVESPPALRVRAVEQLTHGEGLELFPSLSADARVLVHAGRTEGRWNVFVRRVGGQRALDLTGSSGADDSQPALSPDGQTIVFRSERDGGGLFLMGATGESVRRLTRFGFNPTWSPDGTHIAFADESIELPYARQGRSRLHVVEVTGGEPRVLVEGDAVQPSWSPSGARIAYWGMKLGTGNREISTVAATGGEPVPATDDPAVDWSPAWSADGSRLIFASNRGGAMALWSIPVDEGSGVPGGPAEPLTTGGPSEALHPSVASKGGAIALAHRAARSRLERVGLKPEAGRTQGEPFVLTPGAVAFGRPDPSPDGSEVVFASITGQEDLHVVDAAGGAPRKLTDDAFADRIPRWSPVDDRIAFFSNRSGSYEIWIIRSDGSDLRRLTDTPGRAAIEPLWSPDGRRIGFIDTQEARLGILRVDEPADVEWVEWTGEVGDWFLPHSWSEDDRLVGRISSRDGRRLGLGLVDLATGEQRRLRPTGDLPVWLSPKRLMFVEDGSLRLLELKSGEAQTVLPATSPQSFPHFAVSRNGRELVYTRMVETADLWLLRLE